jgi:diphthine synthase
MERKDGSKGRLAFVGLGLNDENGVSLAGLEEIARADVVFAEVYTSMLIEGALDRLSVKTGKNISVLSRTVVEEGTAILNECMGKRVALLVAGDPMTATTHVDLRLRAAGQNIETVIVHGSSVQTAVPGALGLQHYKFGRTTTLPFPQEGYSPTSPYDVVSENLARGLHTLVLLDIGAEEGAFMTANEGLHLLKDMERRVGKGVITDDSLVCVVARAGSPDCVARAGRLGDLLDAEFGPPLHTIVVPGKLHFIEEDALRTFAGMR